MSKWFVPRKRYDALRNLSASLIDQQRNAAASALIDAKERLNGMTRLLGCIIEKHGEMSFDLDDIAKMDPGRMYIVESDNRWHVCMRDDPSEPVVIPAEFDPEMVDVEAMERDKAAAVEFPVNVSIEHGQAHDVSACALCEAMERDQAADAEPSSN